MSCDVDFYLFYNSVADDNLKLSLIQLVLLSKTLMFSKQIDEKLKFGQNL